MAPGLLKVNRTVCGGQYVNNPFVLILTACRRVHAARDDQIQLRYHNGVLIPENLVSAAQRRPADAVFLDILDAMTDENRPVCDSSRAPNYAPRRFASRPERDGYTKRDFEAAMERLFASGDITNEEYGRKSDRRRRIVRGSSAAMLDDAAE